jgi:acyl CoA:acetate/3-ketoacid CoA transferase beta subunit
MRERAMTIAPELEPVALCALADALHDTHEVLVTPIGPFAETAARLAQATIMPEIMLNDRYGRMVRYVASERRTVVESHLPFRGVFDITWSGRRHVIMGAAQIDAFGNQNIAAIGDWARPTSQLLGLRGGPGNGINHAVSYWIPEHTPRVFTASVDVICAPGNDRFAPDDPAGRFLDIRRIVTDLAVLDFDTPTRRMRVRSLHPGVILQQVVDATGFELAPGAAPPVTRAPTPAEREIIAALTGSQAAG